MSFWIRAICARSVGHVAVADLRRATADADFLVWAEAAGLEDEVGAIAERTLRFEGPPGPLGIATMHHEPGDRKIRLERWTGSQAREECEELLADLYDPHPNAERVAALLASAVETVAFELQATDADGIGWSIAWQTALWLAAQGSGLVEADGEWWDPASYEVIWPCDS
jgi:hypothetical protein